MLGPRRDVRLGRHLRALATQVRSKGVAGVSTRSRIKLEGEIWRSRKVSCLIATEMPEICWVMSDAERLSNKTLDDREGAVRPATFGDVEQIAILADEAGGDTLSFILRGIDPNAQALCTYRYMVSVPSGIFSFANCLVAVSNGVVVGMANAFPARLIAEELEGVALTEREQLLRPRIELNDPASFLLNNIAVSATHRRRGVGTGLLGAVIESARDDGFTSLTLHVWADNAGAIAFYRKAGFELGSVPK